MLPTCPQSASICRCFATVAVDGQHQSSDCRSSWAGGVDDCCRAARYLVGPQQRQALTQGFQAPEIIGIVAKTQSLKSRVEYFNLPVFLLLFNS